MSRIGKEPVRIPKGVEVAVSDKNVVTVKGPKGTLKETIDPAIKVAVEEGTITFSRPTDLKHHRAMHGLYRALVSNMVEGVTKGFKTEQELVGVGYRATTKGQQLHLSLGFSHNVVLELPKEVSVAAVQEKGKSPVVTLESINKQVLGAVAAKIRSLRKPEPYKGKGIRFVGENIRRKAGKAAGK
ncbi:MAG: 50S ribosomal protein L6 [Bacteroidetes bacterium]|nr:50S ribosomal protein L6 [Bacteroidota bacterium]MBS1943837.1 50S ribosomal protein L6 [Bacteroidota bacterium]